MWQGIEVGTLPIYMGAPNVNYFMPCTKCILRTDDFKSPKHLAEFLLKLDENDDLYNEYFQWKNDDMRENFVKLYIEQDNCMKTANCRLCEYLRKVKAQGLKKTPT